MAFAFAKADGDFEGRCVEGDLAVPSDGVRRKASASGDLKWQKLVHDSEEAHPGADEEASDVHSMMAVSVPDELSDVILAKTEKLTPRTSLAAAAKYLLDGGLQGLDGSAKKTSSEASVAEVLLEGGAHLEGGAECDDHVRGDVERITMRKDGQHPGCPRPDA